MEDVIKFKNELISSIKTKLSKDKRELEKLEETKKEVDRQFGKGYSIILLAIIIVVLASLSFPIFVIILLSIWLIIFIIDNIVKYKFRKNKKEIEFRIKTNNITLETLEN